MFNTSTELLEEIDVETVISKSHKLIIHNDDVNSFDWVIETLIDICGHTYEQAEQCSLLIHYKGKYAVKTGNFESLKPMKDGICDRGINATIE
jgi:ATP-dependent Clp protease adaptor protein ClpS